MRRSLKPNQQVPYTGSDETYKFRCMEYMNFVLDQVMSDDTRFKLYFTHIENLLRNNLNDVTIQDIEKIKRMIEEGEKAKPDVQETGEFINYDLIERQKYTLKRTHFYLEQGPSQALMYLEGFNPYTLHDVQLTKFENRMEKLQEKNFSILDAMFKMPELEKKREEEFQKENQFKMGYLEGENQFFEFQKFNVEKIVSQPPHQVQLNKTISVKVPEEKLLPEQVINKEKKQQQVMPNITSEKPKQSIVDQSIEIVQIKKKPKKKKPQNPSLEKSVSIIAQSALAVLKPQGQSEIKPNQEQEPKEQKPNPSNPQPNAQQKDKTEQKQQNIDPSNPQKRKYVRKKPLEPRPPKPEKQKPVKQVKKPKQKLQQNKVQQLKKIQSSVEIALLSQVAQLTNLLGGDLLAIATEDKQKSIEELALKDLIKKQIKRKKPKKGDSEQKQKPLSKKSKKRDGSKQLQIMLPYPNCEQEVNRLKEEVENLHKIIQEERLGLVQDKPQDVNSCPVPIEENAEQSNIENIEKIELEVNEPVAVVVANSQAQQAPIPIEQEHICLTPQQLIQEVQQIAIRQTLKEQMPKKIKSNPKQITKKYYFSSEEYKPAEEQIQQSEANGESKEGDYYQPGKQKKIKKKTSNKKKYKMESSRSDKEKGKSKSVQKIQKISQEAAGKPSESMISVDTVEKEKKTKLTPEQREKIKQQREKIKETRQKEKQQRNKLKELEKLQKQVLKLKKADKSQKSSKSQKMSEKQISNSISQVNESSSLAMASHEQKKQVQVSQMKNNEIQQKRGYSQPEKISPTDIKNPLNISNGNSSTRQDISLSFVSVVGIQKSFGEGMANEDELPVIQQSQIPETQKIEEIQMNAQEIPRDKEPLIIGIPAIGSFSAFFEEHIADWDQSGKANEGSLNGSPKRQKPLEESNAAEKAQMEQNPKKKIKLTCKQSHVFEDPQYGIENPSSQKQMYTIQVFERTPSKKLSSEQGQKQQRQKNYPENDVYDKKNQKRQQGCKNGQIKEINEEEDNSSSLSADDD